MSLSINNSPLVKVDNSPRERPALPTSTAGVKVTPPSSNAPVRNDNFLVTPSEVMFNSTALTKLFDMLELVFKTMREMFAGKNITPDALPEADKSPKVKPDAGPRPQVKPAEFRPLIPAPTVPALPGVPDPVVNVTNDANAQVKVEVSINHCHCPETKSEYDKGLKPRVVPIPLPNVPLKLDTTPKPGVTPQPAPKVVPETDTKPNVPPKPDATPTPGVTPAPAPKVIPDGDTKPKVNSDLPQPLPDLTSPAPATDRADRSRPGFNHRTWLRT